MKTAAAFAILLAAPAVAQPGAPDPPKHGMYALYPVYLSKDDTAFVDKMSLVRTGNMVEGWNFNIYAKPTAVTPSQPTEYHWTRFSMNCATLAVTVSWIIGTDLIVTTFKSRLDRTFPVRKDSGWDQIFAEGCGRVPYLTGKAWINTTVAAAQAKGEMARKQ